MAFHLFHAAFALTAIGGSGLVGGSCHGGSTGLVFCTGPVGTSNMCHGGMRGGGLLGGGTGDEGANNRRCITKARAKLSAATVATKS
jgi:hypothetical protein